MTAKQHFTTEQALKIALAHLNEYFDYYTRLKKMESEAEEQHSQS
jgi:hypothetical protein